ncbi:acetyltransferase [Seonamhaeicola sediminis]|uniref:Acetyltransferase n=1 Tax=Seonamhaeicola sediminis TaxID=2528206 RepID=A0A562YHC4_9FLAO|nr:acetyltransferase [Seonamhaeicola sediminis]TWO33975.1 acetyltransferase [Seonamhaeicola sediminis]
MKYLFGASGHAKVVLDVINSNNDTLGGIFDDDTNKNSFLDIPYLGQYEKHNEFSNDSKFLVSIGDNSLRKLVVQRIKQDFFKSCHNLSIVSKYSEIGLGTVVMANAVINAEASIGNHCIINTAAVVEHDCYIEDFVHISPNATITGNVTIGEGSMIGANTVVKQGTKIGKWSIIGAGAVIIEDVPDFATVVGNPGKIIKYNEQ